MTSISCFDDIANVELKSYIMLQQILKFDSMWSSDFMYHGLIKTFIAILMQALLTFETMSSSSYDGGNAYTLFSCWCNCMFICLFIIVLRVCDLTNASNKPFFVSKLHSLGLSLSSFENCLLIQNFNLYLRHVIYFFLKLEFETQRSTKKSFLFQIV